MLCQKQVSGAGKSNSIPQILWDGITCPCPWYLLLTEHSQFALWFVLLWFDKSRFRILQRYYTGTETILNSTQHHTEPIRAQVLDGLLSLNTWRKNNVVITSKRRHFNVTTSKWRRFDVITTSLLHKLLSMVNTATLRRPYGQWYYVRLVTPSSPNSKFP